MIKHKNIFQKITIALLFSISIFAQKQARIIEDFNKNWNFKIGDYPEAINANFNASDWRTLQLPHDWSIEGTFDKAFPDPSQGNVGKDIQSVIIIQQDGICY